MSPPSDAQPPDLLWDTSTPMGPSPPGVAKLAVPVLELGWPQRFFRCHVCSLQGEGVALAKYPDLYKQPYVWLAVVIGSGDDTRFYCPKHQNDAGASRFETQKQREGASPESPLNASKPRIELPKQAEGRQNYTFSAYEVAAMRTANMGLGETEQITCAVLGLTGEAGEVADLLKKVIYHAHPLDRAKLVSELGDVLWYLAYLAESIGVSLEVVAQANVEKLRRRYPNGFSHEASRARADNDSNG